jgi:hypothetical protein
MIHVHFDAVQPRHYRLVHLSYSEFVPIHPSRVHAQSAMDMPANRVQAVAVLPAIPSQCRQQLHRQPM